MLSEDKSPRLTLVGAGPGDPGLMTLKGLAALQSADVVLYDALVSPKIVDMIPPGAVSKYVGKRSGEHSFKQEEINQLIVDFANSHGHVVRLKGGDPFLFGRGFEEMKYAAEHGVAVAVVPGISSALAVPASVHVPLTTRGVSDSVTILTGHTSDGGQSDEIKHAARAKGTVVILMGLGQLDSIVEQFVAAGRGRDRVMVIANGSLPSQKTVTATISTVVKAVKKSALEAPAIIVIGDVVNCPNELKKKRKSS